MNRQAFSIAEDGDGHSAADLAPESRKIAVDILSVPVIDALDRAAIEMMRGFDRRKGLPMRRTGQRQQAENEKSVS
jgi:hypothetical protein